MKKILAFAILSFAVLSCKKDNPDPGIPSVPSPQYTYVKTTGSYWVYDWYQVDSMGNETMMNWNDTIRLVGDTSINGKTYYKYVEKLMGSAPSYWYERDSSGWIVAPQGNIVYSYTGAPMLLTSSSDGYLNFSGYIGARQDITTNFGVKNAVSAYMSVNKVDGSPINNCGDSTANYYRYYVSGIGLVQKEMEYFNLQESQCSKKRAKLRFYYIAP